MAEQSTKQEVQVVFPNDLKGGVYSNFMVVTHTKEEFVLDFMVVVPPVGSVTARVITSPGHLKRMISALLQNVNKYEEKFGRLIAAEEPPKPKMGFHPPVD
ncbi:MAG: DUF3467 domain-containing protein [Dehalococcoidia bacterium]|jgi:hypothetical protein